MSEPSCWSGQASPHQLAEALSLILPHLPLDSRARAACVNPAWHAATAEPALWEELDFSRWSSHQIGNKTLASLCMRAGAALRTLYLDSDACARVTAAGALAALRKGGCTNVRYLALLPKAVLSVTGAQKLAAACPMLQRAACSVCCDLFAAEAVVTALPGPLSLECTSNQECDAFNDQVCALLLAQCLRINATSCMLTSLSLFGRRIGVTAVARLAEWLRVDTMLSSLDLGSNDIGDTGATQLADSLRVNATLKSLDLSWNNIEVAGITQLAECLRVNATLTSLNLTMNQFLDNGAAELARCLGVNAMLTTLVLDINEIGDFGAFHLAINLWTNTTLTHLDLYENQIGDIGAAYLATSLRFNRKLKSLDLGENLISERAMGVLLQECPSQCALTLE